MKFFAKSMFAPRRGQIKLRPAGVAALVSVLLVAGANVSAQVGGRFTY